MYFIINVSCISLQQELRDLHYFSVIDAGEKCTLATVCRSCSTFNSASVSLCSKRLAGLHDEYQAVLHLFLFMAEKRARCSFSQSARPRRDTEFFFQILKTSENFARQLSREKFILRRLINVENKKKKNVMISISCK